MNSITETLECRTCKRNFISNEWTFFDLAGKCPHCGGWLHLVSMDVIMINVASLLKKKTA